MAKVNLFDCHVLIKIEWTTCSHKLWIGTNFRPIDSFGTNDKTCTKHNIGPHPLVPGLGGGTLTNCITTTTKHII